MLPQTNNRQSVGNNLAFFCFLGAAISKLAGRAQAVFWKLSRCRRLPFAAKSKVGTLIYPWQRMIVLDQSLNFGEAGSPRVAILMCAWNGERYLAEQLQSFIDQTHTNWSLHVSDDGSSDATCDIVRRFSEGQHRVVTLRRGPRRGFSRNFMSLVCAPDIAGDYFAFSDQDDIWNKDKLERALNWLTTIPQEVPAVYCSRTEVVDDAGHRLGFSPLFTKPPGFRNAIVQNVGGGNTMAFNASARSLLAAIGDVEVVSHDWWTYQITSAAGGLVRYDPQPSIRYRQHPTIPC